MTTSLYKKGMVLGIIMLFLGASVVPNISGKSWQTKSTYGETLSLTMINNRIIIVDDEGDEHDEYDSYTTIQDAINHASDGDTIWVYSGEYEENIEVDKELELEGIAGEFGGGDDTGQPIINGSLIEGPTINILSDNCNIKNFELINGEGDVIYCQSINNTLITSNKFGTSYSHWAGKYHGITLNLTSNITITGNIFSSHNNGIFIFNSYNDKIYANEFNTYGAYGILIENSINDTINGNSFLSDNNRLFISNSINITVSSNTFTDSGISIYGTKLKYWNSHSIENNYANDKLIFYMSNNQNGGGIPLNVGQIILANCENYNIKNIVISNIDRAIQLGFSSNNNITLNTIKNNNKESIYLSYSSHNSIYGNNINENDDGIYLGYSSNNTISYNTISDNNGFGIWLTNSSYNKIIGNDIENNNWGIEIIHSSNYNLLNTLNINKNYFGIEIDKSSNNTISHNNMLNNEYWGILQVSSFNNFFHSNTIENSKEGITLHDSHNIVIYENNITNSDEFGTKIYGSSEIIIKDNIISNAKIDGIYIYDSFDINISKNTLSNNKDGLILKDSSDVTVIGNVISENNNGIDIQYSSDNTISKNIIKRNDIGLNISTAGIQTRDNTIFENTFLENDIGAYLISVIDNMFYHNNFIDNSEYNAYDTGLNNWNSTWKIDYSYNNCSYTNYRGNYWDDYDGVDEDPENGIGDTPYQVPEVVNKDQYPLIEPLNVPPFKPLLNGKNLGKTGEIYTYIVRAIDANDDNLYYWFDWGDGINSGWIGEYESGEYIEVDHSWSTQGTYTIKVKSKDIHGSESDWATLEVSMPKNKAINPFLLFLERLIERFPILEQILQPIYDKLAGL